MLVCIHCPASVIISIGPVFYFYPHLPILKLDYSEAYLRHNHVKKLGDVKDKMKTGLFSLNQKENKFSYQRKAESLFVAESWFIPDAKYYVAYFEQLMAFMKGKFLHHHSCAFE